ncbi:MAG: glycosyltransferase family 4 protein [Bacteroidetes bacterium]|nr:glycosyltransferase family 4 protein [Bacteroidota bacterium]
MTKKTKVLIISTEFPPSPGGIGSHAFSISKEFTEIGYDLIVAAEQNYSSETIINQFNSNLDFKLERMKATPSLTLLLWKLLNLIKLISRSQSSIIIGTGKHAAWFAYLTARLTLKKCVLIGHGTEFTIQMSKRSKRINKWVYSHADGLIFVSEYTKNQAEKTGVKNNNSIVIHNGADSKKFSTLDNEAISKISKELGITDQFNIITVGSVTARKGQEWVIRALPHLIIEYPQIHYYCAGLPTIEKELCSLATKLGVMNHVHFLGAVEHDELLKRLQTSHLFIMSSVVVQGDFEGFGIAVIEAALCGVPAIVSRNSGVYESILEGKSGLAVEEKCDQEIAKAIKFFIDNPKERELMSKQARERALSEYTWKHQITKYDQFFDSIPSN